MTGIQRKKKGSGRETKTRNTNIAYNPVVNFYSLILSEQQSQIDWVKCTFVDTTIIAKYNLSCQVMFRLVYETLIYFIPMIGWYQKIVIDNVFVW